MFIIDNTPVLYKGYPIKKLNSSSNAFELFDAPINPMKIKIDKYGMLWVINENAEVFR